jgi:non-heme chloroperoxidase
MPYCKAADGTQLFYSVWGEGHPLLFIHGGNVGSEMWTFQIPVLVERGYQCITYDQRGFARSDVPRGGYDFDTLASDLDRLIERLGLSRFSVATFSFGGAVLARYLTRHGSSMVEKAILVSPITPFLLKTPDNPEGLDREVAYEPFRRGLVENRPQIFRDSMDAFFNPATSERPITEGLKAWLVDLALRSPLMPMLEFFRASSETDFRADMRSFTMPTLIIHGDLDVFAPLAVTGARTHRMIEHSRLLTYAGASHGLLFTHQERLNREIAGFLGGRD